MTLDWMPVRKKPLGILVSVWTLLSVGFFLYPDSFLAPWWPREAAQRTTTTGVLALDMAADAIDDMYEGCRSEAAAVIDLFGAFEWNFNSNLSWVWASVKKEAKKPIHWHLKEDHAIVLYMYTKEHGLRREFNAAIRTGKLNYGTYGFKFHYLYFYLTRAIQILHQNQSSCSTVYLRTRQRYRSDVAGANMRFGAFTLASSTNQLESDPEVSCFEIYTCTGADISYYSAANRKGQVLIPPYETFKIVHVEKDVQECGVVYKLWSSKTQKGDLNCKLNQIPVETYLKTMLSHWSARSNVQIFLCLLMLSISSLVLVRCRQRSFVVVVLGALLVLITLLLVARLLHVEVW